jgi:hypothetical protein
VNVIFGRRWDAPICDAASLVATPVGYRCLSCDEPIVEGDAGFLRPVVRDDTVLTIAAIHRECDLTQVLGHFVRVCTCTGWDPSARATAREVERRLNAGALGGM